jgi:FKBP-type peptidyl-prolyl cis-trans isomerase FkpA
LHLPHQPVPILSSVALAFTLLVAGCTDSPTAPSAYAPFSRTDLRLGTGNPAAVGSVLTVHYSGWLYDPAQPEQKGVQFDSSAGRDPFSFTLGAGQVIAGWDQGLVGMNVGGLRRLVIPPSLAYGGTRTGIIPPFATLVFEVELLEVQ